MGNTFPSISFFEACIPKDSLHIRKAKGVWIFIHQILQFVGVMTAKLSVELEEEEGSRHRNVGKSANTESGRKNIIKED